MSGQLHPKRAIVTGAGGLVGHFLVPLLLEQGFEVHAVSRKTRPAVRSVRWCRMDLREPPALGKGDPGLVSQADVVFHAAPLWLLPPWLAAFAQLGVRRVVAFSSTSRITKESSDHPRERETARRLAEAESIVVDACGRQKMWWTLLRPTLIYGGGRDRNVSDIARVIRRLGFFPVAGEGRGKRQPVHAEDLARACLAVLDRPATFGQIYELPGGETLTYAEMVSRIGEGLGRRPYLLHVPRAVLRAALAVVSRLKGLAHLTPEMATRMDRDLTFDAGPARRDFGYDPRPFSFPDEPL